MDVNQGGTQHWSLMITYASPNKMLRQSLWADLREYGRTCNKPWLVAGDFNKTRNTEERFNCSDDLAGRYNNFNLWIQNNHLIDLGFSGPRYTWTRGTTVETRKYALTCIICSKIDQTHFIAHLPTRPHPAPSNYAALSILNGLVGAYPLWKNGISRCLEIYSIEGRKSGLDLRASKSYCNGHCDVDMYQSKTDALNAWRGILENMQFLKKGMRTKISNGHKTLFWYHNWDAVKDIPPNIQDNTVIEIWDIHAGWKWNLIVDLLPEMTLKKL
ncbi:hypothetical protein Cgig2_006456 [Carnegiea gigantea]|uniref:Endonuclease/exonuclease/phosphatase domain-containing protein n=1 Tax=Carnegiea gigantea TaxID=171969 RepID=A0A9Q1Q634_9CARY|nr:hypothetical protein Cgig2_006456 [Carnegiea gigantea]